MTAGPEQRQGDIFFYTLRHSVTSSFSCLFPGDRPKKRRAPTLELDRPLVFFNTVGTCVFILDRSGYVSEVVRCYGTMVWGLVFFLRAFLTSSYSVASLVCLVPVETRRAMHDSHRSLADHNSRAVHDRSRYRHGSSRSECLPQSATGFSFLISFHHFSRPSCPSTCRAEQSCCARPHTS